MTSRQTQTFVDELNSTGSYQNFSSIEPHATNKTRFSHSDQWSQTFRNNKLETKSNDAKDFSNKVKCEMENAKSSVTHSICKWRRITTMGEKQHQDRITKAISTTANTNWLSTNNTVISTEKHHTTPHSTAPLELLNTTATPKKNVVWSLYRRRRYTETRGSRRATHAENEHVIHRQHQTLLTSDAAREHAHTITNQQSTQQRQL